MKRSPWLLKILAFVVVLFALVLGSSTAAVAWSGPSHEWILKTANKLAGGWLNMAVAQARVNDPDNVFQDWNNHHYDAWDKPHTGNAPATVLYRYNLAVRYLKAGNLKAASKEAAWMAHYYEDVWCPWHTTYTTSNAYAQRLYHHKYEQNVLGHEPSSVPAYTPVRVSDPYAETVAAAYYSHNKYSTIAKAYISGKGYAGPGVNSTTKDLLTKAAEGLADLLYSIKLDAANLEQTDPAIVYTGTWSAVSKANASGGSYIRSSDKNASVSIPFTGSQLDIYGMKSTTGGIVDFYVDGAATPSATVNLSLAAPQYKLKLFSLSDPGGGTHVVTLKPNPASPTGKFINLDFVDVNGKLLTPHTVEQTDASFQWTGSWTTTSSSSYSGGSFSYTNTAGSSLSLQFTGVRLDLIARTGPDCGIAKITLDGAKVYFFDLYSVSPAYKKNVWPKVYFLDLYSVATVYKKNVWSTGWLTPGTHTLTVEWTGTMQTAATATIDVDAVLVTS